MSTLTVLLAQTSKLVIRVFRHSVRQFEINNSVAVLYLHTTSGRTLLNENLHKHNIYMVCYFLLLRQECVTDNWIVGCDLIVNLELPSVYMKFEVPEDFLNKSAISLCVS